MTDMKRRSLLVLAVAPLAAALHNPRGGIVVEAEEASMFFAPYYTDRLVPGCPLHIERYAAGTYLTLAGRLMARLPDRIVGGGNGARVVVAEATRDDDGRLRLFVRVTDQAVMTSALTMVTTSNPA